ncbi:MAG: hypothetical protein IT254_08465 [Chitinophagaceae bacterium]|nr:hypothetical protein [Bacteroidota bacterium]MCC6258340.1 hypothetical protein [Chitinophagaceae bacterium]
MRNHKTIIDPVSLQSVGNANYFLSLRYLFLRIAFLNKEPLKPMANNRP